MKPGESWHKVADHVHIMAKCHRYKAAFNSILKQKLIVLENMKMTQNLLATAAILHM